MELSSSSITILFGTCVILLLVSPSNGISEKELSIKRADFPSDFLFGAASSALQVEGAARQGGRGPSIWDHFVRFQSEKIIDRSNMDTTIDSYRRYKEDVKALKELGVDSYRFSISWSRILPNGSLSGGINQEGINYYNNLIDELTKNGIKPMVTLLHFDPPQALDEKYGGFLSLSIVNDFKDYSEICFRSFGDRVKYWITLNEPLSFAIFGFDKGTMPPGRCSKGIGKCPAGNSSIEPYIATHNMLLAHAASARLYKEKFQAIQGGEIGISLVGEYFKPYSESSEDRVAVKRVLDFFMGWYLGPLVNGDYPSSMKKLVKERLPTFTETDKKMVKKSFDFIGINYYTSRYIKSMPLSINSNASIVIDFSIDKQAELRPEQKNGKLIGELAEGTDFLYIYPRGLEKVLQYIQKNYKNPPIYITENGVTEAGNRGYNQAQNDQHRINFVRSHLYRVSQAIKNGANVKGYFYWSLNDSFELMHGYTQRFGLYYVNYKDNLKRMPKMSAIWFRDFLHPKQ